MQDLVFFLISFILVVCLTPLIRRLALRFKIIDWPAPGGRKIHKKPVPLLGGLAIFISFIVVLFVAYNSGFWPEGLVRAKNLIGIGLAGSLLMLGGFLDDKYHLKPYQQIIWPILASLVIIVSGIGINYINNPFGAGFLHLDKYKFEIIRLGGIPYYFTPLADIFTFVWLMTLMYATKLLDGLDGLVSGLTTIGALIIASFCFLTKFYQPDVGSLAMILAGATSGFLIFNFHPAKIFLGEGGSIFLGFILGVLAIISGSKIATTLLIVGIAILDIFWIIWRRFSLGRSPLRADREHLHFKLLETGFSYQGAVIFYWILGLVFGSIVFVFETKGKVIALVVLVILAGLIIRLISKKATLTEPKKVVK